MSKPCGLCYQCCNGFDDLCESVGVAPTCCGEVIQNTASGKQFYYCRGCKDEVPKAVKTPQRVLDALSIQDTIDKVHYQMTVNLPPAGPQSYPPPSPPKTAPVHSWNGVTAQCDDCGMTALQHYNACAAVGPAVADHCPGGKAANLVAAGQSKHTWSNALSGAYRTCDDCGVVASQPYEMVPECPGKQKSPVKAKHFNAYRSSHGYGCKDCTAFASSVALLETIPCVPPAKAPCQHNSISTIGSYTQCNDCGKAFNAGSSRN